MSSEANGIFDKMFEHITKNRSLPEKRTLDQQLNFETTAYIEEKTLGCSDCSILYWKNKRNIFPLLSKVATDFFAVQATNCSSERVNSVGGGVIDSKRNSLSEQNAEWLFWARSNKKSLFK